MKRRSAKTRTTRHGKVVYVGVDLPETVEAFFNEEAKARLTSKSQVIREVLANHVRAIKASRKN